MPFKWELQANACIGTYTSTSIAGRMDLRKGNWVMWFYLRVPCMGKDSQRRNTIGERCVRDMENHHTFIKGVIPNNLNLFYYFNTFMYHLIQENLIFYNFFNIGFSKNCEPVYPILLEQRIIWLYVMSSNYISSKYMETGHFYYEFVYS